MQMALVICAYLMAQFEVDSEWIENVFVQKYFALKLSQVVVVLKFV